MPIQCRFIVFCQCHTAEPKKETEKLSRPVWRKHTTIWPCLSESILLRKGHFEGLNPTPYSVLVGRKERSFSFDAKIFLKNQESMPAEVAEDL